MYRIPRCFSTGSLVGGFSFTGPLLRDMGSQFNFFFQKTNHYFDISQS